MTDPVDWVLIHSSIRSLHRLYRFRAGGSLRLVAMSSVPVNVDPASLLDLNSSYVYPFASELRSRTEPRTFRGVSYRCSQATPHASYAVSYTHLRAHET